MKKVKVNDLSSQVHANVAIDNNYRSRNCNTIYLSTYTLAFSEKNKKLITTASIGLQTNPPVRCQITSHPHYRAFHKSADMSCNPKSQYLNNLLCIKEKEMKLLKETQVSNFVDNLFEKNQNTIRNYYFNKLPKDQIATPIKISYLSKFPKQFIKQKLLSDSERVYPLKYAKKDVYHDEFAKIYLSNRELMALNINKTFFRSLKKKILSKSPCRGSKIKENVLPFKPIHMKTLSLNGLFCGLPSLSLRRKEDEKR